ncbi:MAG TPA: ATP-binding protein [Anaerolineaceae bacterium]|nr:ATP-binding protein [Anaerolineaceae bacterium]
MRQLVILSGKGGTGKTSIGAVFAHLQSVADSKPRAVMVDADVDAANLSLVLKPDQSERSEFWGGSLAEIDTTLCTGCESCKAVCRYDAIFPNPNDGNICWIDPVACDGCAACVYACPTDAIKMVVQQEGYWFKSETPYGTLFHAELFPGRENSGKLVTLVKQHARLWAEDTSTSLVIIDGPPGIGCPVISACAGADLGLIVTEPSLAGLHDLIRIQATLHHFRVPQVICINKADIYTEGARQIREFALEKGVQILGEIPFDESISHSMLMGSPVTEAYPQAQASRTIEKIWEQTVKLLTSLDG